jgi:hypothetical protein
MRRGVILVEVVVGCALAALLLALCVQMLSLTAFERRDVEQRSIALEQAANLIERVAAMPYDQITPEKLAELKLPPEVEPILPGGAAKWFVTDETGDLPAKRVRVEIAWRGGRPQRPAKLTTWVYPQPSGAAP